MSLSNRNYNLKVTPELRRLLIHCEKICTVDCCHRKAFLIDLHTIGQWIELDTNVHISYFLIYSERKKL